ncbi:glycosyltransferase family 2 protein [Paenibacillus illinoisensis]|uniref:Glycosyltransferase 2-like domain-containing protein n=1 Tax=Paenibacillus illinoisensis TaxID=59845 RepID=A0A2W0CFL4_9BACL|nr:glycosyltransferase family 2 protein [Paenibacillus illinoisensis]PYY29579.1 Uncharacterized protein PIL02S_02544 [Paenibacillus illinoisensis]
MSLPISACILTLNEEKQIGESIKSILDYVEEVVVLDTGSTDRTIEEATVAGARVHQVKWVQDFSYARNELINLASSPYILMMDADERYKGNGKDLLQYINQSSLPGRVKIINKLDGGEQTETFTIRIFPNNGVYKYKGTIHEQLTESDAVVVGEDTEIPIYHFGYTKENIERKRKVDRNLDLLLRELDNNAEDPYLLYQIAKTFYVSKNYVEASSYYKMSLLYLEENNLNYKFIPNLLLQYSYSLLNEKNWVELEKNLLESIEKYPDFTDLYYIYASWIIEEKKIELFKILPELYKKCLEIGEADPTKYETTKGVGSYKALYNLGLYYELTGNTAKAKECYTLSGQMNYPNAINRLNNLSNI